MVALCPCVLWWSQGRLGVIVVDVPLHAAGRCCLKLQCSTGRPYVALLTSLLFHWTDHDNDGICATHRIPSVVWQERIHTG